MQITVINRGPDRAALEVLPHLWYRNTWSRDEGAPRPVLEEVAGPNGFNIIRASHPGLGEYYLVAQGAHELLFTNNETNEERLLGRSNPTRYVKDGINDYVVQGRYDAVNPEQSGTKAAVRYELDLDPGERAVLRLCLGPARSGERFKTFDEIISSRRDEADEFYASLTPPGLSDDDFAIMRQGFAGALWGKQGVIEALFDCLEDWREVATDVRGRALACGHFIPEERPEELVRELRRFLR